MAASPPSATPAGLTGDIVRDSFAELERQRELIANCTLLYQQLTDHIASLERGIAARSESLRTKRRALDVRTARAVDSLRRRELSIDAAVDRAVAKVDALVSSARPEAASTADLAGKLRALCSKMDAAGFWELVVANRKEAELLRSEISPALGACVDPARLVMDAIEDVFPVDKRQVKSPLEVSWACVLVLEALAAALADPEVGSERQLVPAVMRERAKEMALGWKNEFKQRGGVEFARAPDTHAFLQHVVTFGIANSEDKPIYRQIITSFSWRRQMPRLAVLLGLEDEMEDIIEELITKGQQLDAVNFAFEAGLQSKFQPVPLLKSFLEDLKNGCSSLENQNTGNIVNNAGRKGTSAIRAVIKCVEDHNLQAELPIEDLQKQLEDIEKAAKSGKKKAPPIVASSPSSGSTSSGSGAPASKRIRVNTGPAPMPPAKAGRLMNHAPESALQGSPPVYMRSPVHAVYPVGLHYTYGSAPAIRDPYASPPMSYADDVANVGIGMSYPSPPLPPHPPVTYAAYGGYSHGVLPAFHQAYYR